MGAAVVACVDAPPVLEAAEPVLDAMALPVEDGVVRDRHLARAGGRDAGCDAALGERGAEAVAVVAAVTEQFAGRRQDRQQQGSPLDLAEVEGAFAEYERALMENDIAVLDALFADAPETVRYDVGEQLYGFEEIATFRRARAGGSPSRTVRRQAVACYGKDFATSRRRTSNFNAQDQTGSAAKPRLGCGLSVAGAS